MPSHSARLLVVDDIKENRAILLRRLARQGFEVAEATGGQDALDKVEREPFDLVLLDIMMPDVNGIEVLKRLRQRHSPASLPVIMVTANNESAETVQALRLGANDYITKPVDFPVALARIEAQLDRKEAQQRLEGELDKADQRLKSLVDQLPTGLALKDPDGHFLIVNAQYGAYLGFDARGAVGRKQNFLYDSAAAEIARLDAVALVSHRPEQAEIEVDQGEAGDPCRNFVVTSFPILYSGVSVGVGTSLVDVTARCRAERDLIIAKEAAEAGNRAKSDFLAAMSHELRTPLNAIIGFADVMEGGLLGPLGNATYTVYAKDIGDSGRHLLGIINDVLDIAKQDAGHLDLYADEVEIAPMLEHCMHVVGQAASKGGVELVDITKGDLPMVLGDRRRLTQILLNLLSNAIKFTPAGGRVELSAAAADGSVLLQVADTGIGMEESEIEIALEPFRQVDSKLNRKYEGTGLGLPISKKLTEMHGGVLSISSAPGRGTRVTVVLPPERVLPGPLRDELRLAS